MTGKGWKALGYESFVEYGKKSLGYEKGYLYQLADAGEISLQLGYDSESAMADSQPKERHLRPLKPVPEESRKEIWEEATRKAEEENAKLTAKRVEEAVEDIIEIGRELTEVKAGLPHGQFEIWIKVEFQMNREMANNFMQVAGRFGNQMSDYLTFKPSVLYALSAPSTPEPVIEKAIEKAESGEKVTVSEVKTWKAEYEEEKRHIYRLVDAAEYSVTLVLVLCARLGGDIPFHRHRWRWCIAPARHFQLALSCFC